MPMRWTARRRGYGTYLYEGDAHPVLSAHDRLLRSVRVVWRDPRIVALALRLTSAWL